MGPCAPLTDPQFNNAPILLDGASLMRYFSMTIFLSAMSSFNGDWPGAETSAFGFQMPDTGSHHRICPSYLPDQTIRFSYCQLGLSWGK
jgi:hypothetical protein